MRICYVSHTSSHFTAPYVDYFSSQGHEVHLISFQHDDLPNAIMHHPLNGRFDPQTNKRAYLLALWRAIRIIRRLKPDILHAHYLTSNGFAAAMSGVHPFIVSARGSDVHSSLHSGLKRRVILYTMRRADLVNPVSVDLEDKVLALGVPREKVLRLTQGIAVRDFMVDRTKRRPGPIRMICTRALLPVYQCDRIIRALTALRRGGTSFEFLFAGRGALEEQLKAQVRQCGLSECVRFAGGYTQAELPAMLADADIYVSASLWDGTSPALLEAMASGVFPVVSDIPANREWLNGDADSLLFDPRDDARLLNSLSQAVAQESLRAGAVAVNHDRVLEKADRQTNMRILASEYMRLAGQPGRTRSRTTVGGPAGPGR